MPDFELWWLLPIPVLFFAMGWIAARIDIKHLLRESRALPLSYFRGLNFLLNEQPDKAIESFIEVVKVDPQTIDLHFALGSLFRRQGEIDRAFCFSSRLSSPSWARQASPGARGIEQNLYPYQLYAKRVRRRLARRRPCAVAAR